MQVVRSEKISFYSHFLGFFLSILGLFFLIFFSYGTKNFIVSIIYGFSIISLFGASSLYHYKKREENEKTIWRKLDHLAIFLMIAGTYTPVCYLFLDGAWMWSILSIQWGIVFLGFFFKLFFINAPRIFYTALYLLMGWVAIVPMKIIVTNMHAVEIVFLFLGAFSFTVGGIIYAVKKPDPVPGFFGFHEIFHIFILLGGIFHFLMVVFSIG